MTNYGFSSSLCSTSSLIQSNLLHQKVIATFAVFLSGFVPIVGF
ncbi:hypothetical protein HanXRQr2_Chr05g0219131 [Helianthus annuus]|uniref:Uncharacterized protein n=1 Tax=Helianthus annuus TaxID=4232 RepID=A0A9K3J0C4_HELAN|nr:hypothetical protein HanXRQr2_Chr05g0219131 [Helianthus annuus]